MAHDGAPDALQQAQLEAGSTVRWFLLILALPSIALAGGPKYTYPTPPGLDDEMHNLYHDIQNVPNGIYKSSSMTLQGITVDSITVRSGYFGTTPGFIFQAPIVCLSTTTSTTTSSSFALTASSCTINLTNASHRVRVQASGEYTTGPNTTNTCGLSLFRNSTSNNLCTLGNAGTCASIRSPAAAIMMTNFSVIVYDSPGTINATTYAVGINSADNTNACQYNKNQNYQTMELLEVQ